MANAERGMFLAVRPFPDGNFLPTYLYYLYNKARKSKTRQVGQDRRYRIGSVRDTHGGGWSRNINARYLHSLMVYL